MHTDLPSASKHVHSKGLYTVPSNSLEMASTLPRSENLSSAMVGVRFARIIMDPGRALSSDGFVFYVHCPDVRDEVIGDIHLELLGHELDVVFGSRVEKEYCQWGLALVFPDHLH